MKFEKLRPKAKAKGRIALLHAKAILSRRCLVNALLGSDNKLTELVSTESRSSSVTCLCAVLDTDTAPIRICNQKINGKGITADISAED